MTTEILPFEGWIHSPEAREAGTEAGYYLARRDLLWCLVDRYGKDVRQANSPSVLEAYLQGLYDGNRNSLLP